MDFIPARNFTPGPRANPVRLIVIHDMESPETVHTAEDCAHYFAGLTAPQASCHYCVDADSIVQSVRDDDIAWHCPGANHDGIGIEHAGFARQSRDEWLDEYDLAMLRLSADLVVDLCAAYSLPLRWLGANEVAAGMAGITTHRACTEAFHTAGGHTDPGADFPDDVYIRFINEAAEKRRGIPPVQEDDMIQFPVRPLPSGRWATARAVEGGRKLALVGATWAAVPDEAVETTLGTAVLDCAVALDKPAGLRGDVRVGQIPGGVLVSDDDGDYAFYAA